MVNKLSLFIAIQLISPALSQDSISKFFTDAIEYQTQAATTAKDLGKSHALMNSSDNDSVLLVIQAYVAQAPALIGNSRDLTILRLGLIADGSPERLQALKIILAHLLAVADVSELTAANVTRLSNLAPTPAISATILESRKALNEHRNRVTMFAKRLEQLLREEVRNTDSEAKAPPQEYLIYIAELVTKNPDAKPLSLNEFLRSKSTPPK